MLLRGVDADLGTQRAAVVGHRAFYRNRRVERHAQRIGLDEHIPRRLDAKAHRPIDREGVPHVDIVVHHDGEFRKPRQHGPGAPDRLLGLAFVFLFHRDHEISRAPSRGLKVQVGDRESKVVLELFVNGNAEAEAADATALARRHLAHERLEDGITPRGHAFHVDDERRAAPAHVARVLPERPFFFPDPCRNLPFEDDLRSRRHFEIRGLAFYNLHGFSPQPSRDRQLIHAERNFGNRDEADHRVRSENDRHRSRPVVSLVLLYDAPEVLQVVAEVDAGLALPLELHPVGADVSDAGLGVPADDVGRREVGRGVVRNGPDRNGELHEIHFIAAQNNFLTGAVVHKSRWNGVRLRFAPAPVNLLEVQLGLQGERVNLARSAQNSRYDGNRKSLHPLEHERRPPLVGNFAEDELGDGGKLPVLVHLFGDAEEFSLLLQRSQILT